MITDEYGFLARNARGLYLVHNGKYMFIDRTCKEELDVGLCRFRITKDFDKYGFIFAKNVKTGSLEEAVERGIVDISDISGYYEYCGVKFWFYCKESSNTPYTLVNNEVVSLGNVSWFLGKERICWDHLSIKNIIISEVLGKVDGVPLSDDDMLEFLIPSIGGFSKVLSVNNRIFKIINRWGGSEYRIIMPDNKVMLFSCLGVDLESLGEVRDITALVEDFMINRNLCTSSLFEDKDGLYHKKIEVLGCEFDRVFLPVENYTQNKYNSVKDILDTNMLSFETFKKKIGKNCTKQNFEELSKLNTKDFQLGRGF